MGEKEAEIFLSSRMSNANFYEKTKGSVRYMSNVPESLKQLKSLKTFKEQGRWKLMPKENERRD